MPETDFYSVLGVAPTASAGSIRSAYRAWAKHLHPDVNRSADASTRFALVAEAYEVLSDREKRFRYDQSAGVTGGRGEGRTGGRRAPSSPQPAHYSWMNIASSTGGAAPDVSEFDELYDTFFGHGKRPAGAEPGAAVAGAKRPRKHRTA